ncbi:hypothetical protein L1887_60216 [Cichorium endivia]|nr:hypothetical protein L1887_60216 [Cichorium endivia]
MARRQRHELEVARIPRAEEDASVGRIVFDLVDHLAQLVHPLPRIVGIAVLVLGAKVTPLEAVHGAEIALATMLQAARIQKLARAVAVPNVHALVREQLGVGLARHEPEQLLEYAAEEDALGGEQRQRAVGEVEAQQLRRKQRHGARARAVGPRLARRDDARDELEVLRLVVLGRACGAGCALNIALGPGLGREHSCDGGLGKVVMRIAQHHHASRIHLKQTAVGERKPQPACDKDTVEVAVADEQHVARLGTNIVALVALVDVPGLELADLGDDRVDAVAHVLCRLSRQLVGTLGVVRRAFGPNIPAGMLCSNLIRLEALVGAVVPLAAVLEDLYLWDVLALAGGDVVEHDLERALRARPRADKDVVELGGVDELAVADADNAGRELAHHLFAVRCERDVGAAGVLSRDGPFRLAVTREEYARHRHLVQNTRLLLRVRRVMRKR